MDPQDRIDEISTLVEGARGLPLSASCLVNRGVLLGLLDELRADLPGELRHARALLEERDEVVAAGNRTADTIVASGQAEHRRLVSAATVTATAEREAGQIVADARAAADLLRAEADDYVDGKLAAFELVLQRTLEAVERGRDRLSARGELGGSAGIGSLVAVADSPQPS